MMSPTLTCGFCGSDNQARARFCRSCGHPLQTSKYHSTTGSLLPNVLLKQRYRIAEPIGQGGFGAVYRAEDTQLGNRQVAIKEMSQNGLSSQEQQEAADAFRQEAIILARLQHPNLPSIFDHFEENQRWYLVMSFIDGETLESYLHKQPGEKLPLNEAIDVGVQLCTVLDYLHNQHPPIIFRDLKPANIMRAPNGHLYLIDFGIARHFKPGQMKDTSALGSPGYAAPEQHGHRQTTPRSDIYSLGATLHQVISGHDPASSPFRLPPLQSLVPAVPAGLATFITQMLDMDESKRPANMLVIKQALQPLAPTPQQAPPAQPKPLQAQPPQPKPYPLKLPEPEGTLLFLYTGRAVPTMSEYRWSAAFLSNPPSDSSLSYLDPWELPTPIIKDDEIAPLDIHSAVWSPDGTRIAFVSSKHSRKKRPGTIREIPIPAPRVPQTPVDPADRTNSRRRWSSPMPQPAQTDLSSANLRNLGDAPAPRDYLVQVWSSDGREEPLFYRGDTILWQPDGTAHALSAGRFRSIASFRSDFSLDKRPIYSPDGTSYASVESDGVRVNHIRRGQPSFTYREHSSFLSFFLKPSSVSAIVWSPDGTRIASAYQNGTVQLWNADGSGQPVICKTDPYPASIKWSPDGARIALSHTSGITEIWNTDGSGQQFSTWGSSVEWSPDGIFIAFIQSGGDVIVCRADGSGQPLIHSGHSSHSSNRTPSFRSSPACSVAWSPDSRRIASTSDGKVQIWNTDGSGQSFTYTGHASPVLAVAWSPDGRQIASASDDGSVHVWNSAGGGPSFIYSEYTAFVNNGSLFSSRSPFVQALEWSPESKRIVSIFSDETILIWHAGSYWRLPFAYRHHTGVISSVAWSPDGTRILSASYDGALHIWNAESGEQISIYKNQTVAVLSVAWSPDSTRFAAAFRDGKVLVGNADGSGKAFIYQGHQNTVLAIAWSPDGARIASASQDGTVQVWNIDGSGQPFTYTRHGDVVSSVAWSPDGRRIVSASRAKEDAVHVWNADGSGQPFIYEGHNYFAWQVTVPAVAWSPDGKRIASCTAGASDAPDFASKAVHIWNADGSGQPFIYKGHKDSVLSVAWSPDSTRIVSTSNDGVVQVWSAG